MLIDRKNVVSEVKKRYSACRSFLEIELESRIIAAALEILKITKIDEIPAEEDLPFNLENEKKERKKLFIQKLASKIVDKFILKVEDLESFLIMKQQQTIEV